MMNMNQFSEAERNIVNRFSGRNEKALAKNISRMLPYLPASELETALSVLAKLQEKPEKQSPKRVKESFEMLLSRLTALRGYLLIGSTSQLRCYPV